MKLEDGQRVLTLKAISLLGLAILGLGLQVLALFADLKPPLPHLILVFNIPIYARILPMMIPVVRKAVYGRE